MACPDVIEEVHQFLTRNELERSMLVNRDWRTCIRGGSENFEQKRVFDHLWIGRRLAMYTDFPVWWDVFNDKIFTLGETSVLVVCL